MSKVLSVNQNPISNKAAAATTTINPHPPLALAVSQEGLNDLSKETALIHASEERAANDVNSNFGENYDFFWCLTLSLQTVTTHFSIFVLFYDAFNICISFRGDYLQYNALFGFTILGSIALIFAVNHDTYYNLAFLIAYITSVLRLVINGVLIGIYYLKVAEMEEKNDKYESFVNEIKKNETAKFEVNTKRDRSLFRTRWTFGVLGAICIIMILIQIWGLVVSIPRSHSWLKRKTTPRLPPPLQQQPPSRQV